MNDLLVVGQFGFVAAIPHLRDRQMVRPLTDEAAATSNWPTSDLPFYCRPRRTKPFDPFLVAPSNEQDCAVELRRCALFPHPPARSLKSRPFRFDLCFLCAKSRSSWVRFLRQCADNSFVSNNSLGSFRRFLTSFGAVSCFECGVIVGARRRLTPTASPGLNTLHK